METWLFTTLLFHFFCMFSNFSQQNWKKNTNRPRIHLSRWFLPLTSQQSYHHLNYYSIRKPPLPVTGTETSPETPRFLTTENVYGILETYSSHIPIHTRSVCLSTTGLSVVYTFINSVFLGSGRRKRDGKGKCERGKKFTYLSMGFQNEKVFQGPVQSSLAPTSTGIP